MDGNFLPSVLHPYARVVVSAREVTTEAKLFAICKLLTKVTSTMLVIVENFSILPSFETQFVSSLFFSRTLYSKDDLFSTADNRFNAIQSIFNELIWSVLSICVIMRIRGE